MPMRDPRYIISIAIYEVEENGDALPYEEQSAELDFASEDIGVMQDLLEYLTTKAEDRLKDKYEGQFTKRYPES